MKRFFLMFAMLTLAACVSAAQTATNSPQQSSPEQNKPGQTAPSDTQNNAAGSVSGSQNPTGAAPVTANPNPTTQDPTAPTTSQPAPAAQSQRPQGQSPALPQGSAPLPSMNTADSDTLKGQLDQAYQSEPSLSGSNIQVQVTDTEVQLHGSVPTGKDKTTAKRIAQSYAGNRKVVEKLAVTGRGVPGGSPASQKQ